MALDDFNPRYSTRGKQQPKLIYTLGGSKNVYFAPNEMFLSFNSDIDAEIFYMWWHKKGEASYKKFRNSYEVQL